MQATGDSQNLGATQSGKPVTEYTTPEEYIENYATFFDQILESPAKK